MSVNNPNRPQMKCRHCGKRSAYHRSGLCQACVALAHDEAREQERAQQEREAEAARVA